jgi:hypothetical protein
MARHQLGLLRRTITPSTTVRTACWPISNTRQAGIVRCRGKNLAEARAPGYLDTPNGRIALVAATAAFRPWNQAGEQRPDLRGRPGINPLGFQTTYSVDAKAFEQLQRISHSLGFEKSNERARKHFYSDKEIASANASELSLLGNRYVLGEGFSIATEANERDLKDNTVDRRSAPPGRLGRRRRSLRTNAVRLC